MNNNTIAKSLGLTERRAEMAKTIDGIIIEEALLDFISVSRFSGEPDSFILDRIVGSFARSAGEIARLSKQK